MKKPTRDIQMLGPQMTLEGTLVFEGTLILNGHARGTIESKEGTIVVGDTAVIEADIFVKTATISGEIRGTVRAGERIELHPPARVFGDLIAPVVLMDAGVAFDGKCTTIETRNTGPENQALGSSDTHPKKTGGLMKSLKFRKGSEKDDEAPTFSSTPA